ncbi:hypothetical protein HKI87_14g77080 [Chloropicon roscoffensis]|uniref:Lon N-terminal domain-containing protein n=1 Tax=Chloropicon roscoffensis TaxID=1461544 RepID=A0AAX4PIN0_9CHLO
MRLRGGPQRGRGGGRRSSARTAAGGGRRERREARRTARDFIASECPVRSPITGKYGERPTERQEDLEEAPWLATDDLVLPGEAFALPSDDVAAMTGNIVVLTHRGGLERMRGSRSVRAEVGWTSDGEAADVRALERVSVDGTREVGGATLCRFAPLPDRWAYFEMLESLSEGDGALEDCRDALAALAEAVGGLATIDERWTSARAWLGIQAGEVDSLSASELVETCHRASFAGLLVGADPEVRARAMSTTDLGERMELAVAHASRAHSVARLNRKLQ